MDTTDGCGYRRSEGRSIILFSALKIPKHHLKHHPKPQLDVLDDALEVKVIDALKANNKMKQKEIAKEFGTLIASVQRTMKWLVEQGRIVRKGDTTVMYTEKYK